MARKAPASARRTKAGRTKATARGRSSRSTRGSGRGAGGATSRLAAAVRRLKALLTTATILAAGVFIGSFLSRSRDAPAPPADEAAARDLDRRIKVEVLNGSGEPGAARAIGDRLMALGYDVVAVDNADRFDHRVTHVIDRSGAGDALRALGRGIGVDSLAVQLDRDLHLDATVILGSDWRARLYGDARRP